MKRVIHEFTSLRSAQVLLMRKPDFSIVIPLYNKLHYVQAALESVLQQGVENVEVIVVDDGSTDASPELVESLALPQVTLLRQANSGVSAARNRGLEQARGEIVCFLDADDKYKPGFLNAVAALAARYPDAGTYATGFEAVWASGERKAYVFDPRLDASATLLVRDFYRRWSKGPFLQTSSVAVRRSFLQQCGVRFPQGEKLGEDQDVWFQLVELAPLAYRNAPLAEYTQAVANSATAGVRILDVLPCYERLAERLRSGAMPADLRAGARRLLSSHLINVAKARTASGQLRPALALMCRAEARGNLPYWLRAWPAVLRQGR